MDIENYYRTADESIRDYYDSLPNHIKKQILDSNVQISTLGELMQVAEHFRKT